jgi:hypothetical protein
MHRPTLQFIYRLSFFVYLHLYALSSAHSQCVWSTSLLLLVVVPVSLAQLVHFIMQPKMIKQWSWSSNHNKNKSSPLQSSLCPSSSRLGARMTSNPLLFLFLFVWCYCSFHVDVDVGANVVCYVGRDGFCLYENLDAWTIKRQAMF